MSIPAVSAKHLKRALALVAKGLSPTDASKELAAQGIRVSKTRIYDELTARREKRGKAKEPPPPPPAGSVEPSIPSHEEPTNDVADDMRRINVELEHASKFAALAASKGDLVRYGALAKLVADLVAKRARVRPPAPPDVDAEKKKHEMLAREVIGMLEQYLAEHEQIDPATVALR